jgi:16S rRNA G966 N2-methylase RsmD
MSYICEKDYEMETETVKLTQVKINKDNPRTITNDKFNKLINSLLVFPRMLTLRPVVVNERMEALGGNMRTHALKEIAKSTIDDIRDRLSGIADFAAKTQGEREALLKYWSDWLDKPTVQIVRADGLTEDEQKQFIIKDNVAFGQWDFDALANKWDNDLLGDWGMDVWNENPAGLQPAASNDGQDNNDDEDIDDSEVDKPEKHRTLEERFIIPPFSILNTTAGRWQQHKDYWLSLGIKSELGRSDETTFGEYCIAPRLLDVRNKLREKIGHDPSWKEFTEYCDDNNIPYQHNTSIFDPVLCELVYKWFCTEGGKILDPFAGGSVRGIVASKLGYQYFGRDLRKEQINANCENAKEILSDDELKRVQWNCGDSTHIDEVYSKDEADLLFSCPPYVDLEVYSKDEADLSNMPYDKFLNAYTEIIRKGCECLKNNRFAVFVVGSVRNKQGFFYPFVQDTIRSFESQGVHLYNDMILANQIGSLAMRVSNQFSKSRKIGKRHQYVLVFYKGDPKKIRDNYPDIDLSYMDDMTTTEEDKDEDDTGKEN